MKILYFAWLRTQLGVGQEELSPPPGVATVGDLVAHLQARGGAYAAALARPEAIKAAVNQEHAPFSHPVKAGDEVALFPPVTGG